MSKFIELELGAQTGVSGHYKLAVRNPDGTLIRELEFDNLITNNGLDRIFAGRNTGGAYSEGYLAGPSIYCQVGTGTAAPAYTDTALTSYFAQMGTLYSTTSGVQSSAPYYGYQTVTYRFPAGTFNNTVITEVGISIPKVSAQVLFSHALITDNSGTPTPITLSSSDILDISYTIKLVVPTSDTTFSTTISGTSYSVTCRPIGVTTNSIPYQPGNAGWAIMGLESQLCGINIASPSTLSSYGNPPQPPLAGTRTTDAFVTLSNDAALVDQTSTYSWGANPAFVSCTVTRSAYTNGNYYVDFSYLWGAGVANSGDLRTLKVAYVNGGAWQYLFDQVIPKTSSQQLVLNTRVSLARL
jgi:hypothetical protein